MWKGGGRALSGREGGVEREGKRGRYLKTWIREEKG